MSKSKVNLISLLLTDIISRRTNDIENYNYDTMEEEISEILDWLFIREKDNKVKIMEIVFKAFNEYSQGGNRFLNSDTLKCLKHLYKFTKKYISSHTSFNILDEDEKESIFEPTSDYLIIRNKKDKIELDENKKKKRGRCIIRCEHIYNYKRIKELKANPYVKIVQYLPGVSQTAGCLGKIVYKKFEPKI